MNQADIKTLPAVCALISASGDPYVNLSFEEQLFEDTRPGHRRLLIYSNTPCVVMGKHQNPWIETDPDHLRASGVPLLRRISGGGTVYHDRGNLNYSFLVDGELFSKADNLELVREVVAGLLRLRLPQGLPRAPVAGQYPVAPSGTAGTATGPGGTITAAPPAVTLSNYGDLLVDGAKVGGIALAHKGSSAATSGSRGGSGMSRSRRSLHHGTVLVDADLSTLRDTLRRKPPPIVTHAVASRPARVANLAEFWASGPSGASVPSGASGPSGAMHSGEAAPSVDSLAWLLADAFVRRYGGPKIEVDEHTAGAGTRDLVRRHRSREWLYGKTPKFTVYPPVDISNGDSTMSLLVDRGIVQDASDLPVPFGAMVGKYFDLSAFFHALEEAG